MSRDTAIKPNGRTLGNYHGVRPASRANIGVEANYMTGIVRQWRAGSGKGGLSDRVCSLKHKGDDIPRAGIDRRRGIDETSTCAYGNDVDRPSLSVHGGDQLEDERSEEHIKGRMGYEVHGDRSWLNCTGSVSLILRVRQILELRRCKLRQDDTEDLRGLDIRPLLKY
jgi:hypothetical protein